MPKIDYPIIKVLRFFSQTFGGTSVNVNITSDKPWPYSAICSDYFNFKLGNWKE